MEYTQCTKLISQCTVWYIRGVVHLFVVFLSIIINEDYVVVALATFVCRTTGAPFLMLIPLMSHHFNIVEVYR